MAYDQGTVRGPAGEVEEGAEAVPSARALGQG